VSRVLHESGHVQYEHDCRYNAIYAHDHHGYLGDYANDGRDYVISDGCAIIYGYVRGYVCGDHDYALCIQNEAFRSSIQDCDPSIHHVIHVHANLPSYSSQQANARDVNENNCDVPRHAHHYEGFA